MKKILKIAYAAAALLVAVCVFAAVESCLTKTDDAYNNEKYEVELDVSGYTLLSEDYNESGISISYPRIIQYPDVKKSDTLNKYLLEKAMDGSKLWAVSKDVTAEIGWRGTFMNDRLFSVVYFGEFYVKGAAHPVNIFYTVNLGLDGADVLGLNDFYRVDKKLADYIIGKDYSASGQQAAIAYLKDREDFLEQLEKADSGVDSSVQMYFTSGGIGLSFSVPHVLGDHIEFEYTYDELAAYAL